MKKHFSLLITILCLILSLTSCGKEKSETIPLTNFQYSLNGLTGEYIPLENQLQLKSLRWLIPNKKGYIWLKTEFTVPESFINEDLSVYLGITKIATKVYLNGYLLGGEGSFPPNISTNGEVPSYYEIPKNFLFVYSENKNVLQIQVWVDMQGQIDTNPFIAPSSFVYRHFQFESFHSSKISLIVSYVMIIVAFIYFILYLFKRNDKANLSFARLCFCSSLYLISIGIGEYPVIKAPTEYQYLSFLKFSLGLMAIITSYFAISFIRDYLRLKEKKVRIIHRRVITIIPAIAVFIPNNMNDFFMVLYFAYTMIGIHMVYAIRIITKEIKRKNKKVRSLLLGFLPVQLSLVIIVILFFCKKPFNKLYIILGWQITILVFVAIMIIKFAKLGKRVEFLNENLEHLVRERTKELQNANNLLEESNTKLEFEKRRSEKEIALAAFVQQGFYKNSLPPLKDWDIHYYFKPLLGVSGDLYDFFTEDGKLDGFGIFDVSGHGIASGLVTMLVKNIIHQEFYQGTALPLIDVIDIINNRVIEEKGSIENYLTGILARVITSSKIEFVNAGHPVPLLFDSSKNETIKLDANDERKCGVIGIPDLPAVFELQTIDLHSGDTLLLFTDGIIEAENEKHEAYGLERLIDVLTRAQTVEQSEQIQFILTDVQQFIKSDKINDDITILLIHKK